MNLLENRDSIYKNYFPDLKLWYAYDERDLVNYYNEYNNLMSFWKSLYHDYIYDVSYENLVSNPKEEIQKLLNIRNNKYFFSHLPSFRNYKNKVFDLDKDNYKFQYTDFHELFMPPAAKFLFNSKKKL